MSKKSSKNKGMSSSFKASNIQTYAEGGEMEAASGGPGHPFKKWIERTNPTANLYASPFYTNSLVGNRIPGYRAGFSTATGAGQYSKPVGGFGGVYVGQQYDPHIPSNTFLSPTSQLDNLNFGNGLNLAGNPEGPNIMFGGNIGWQGKAVKGGGQGGGGIFPNAMPRLEAMAEYAPSTGLGFGAKFGSVFPISKGNYRQGQVKGGIHNASLLLEPYTGGVVNSTNASGWGWGLKADAEYRPKFLDRAGIPGHGYLTANLASPIGAPSKEAGDIELGNATGSANNVGIKWRPNLSIEGGYRMPLQKMDEIDLPKFGKGSMSDLIRQADENEENNPLEQEPFIPNEGVGWGESGKVNASPIHKKWQETANDIYIPNQQGGNTVEWPPAEEGTESFAAGGSMGGWPPDKFLRGANLYSNAFYTNTNTGSLLPQANFGLSKSWGPKYAKNTLSADVGMPYGNNQIGDFGQNTSELGQQNFTETGSFGDPNLGAFDAKNPFSVGLHYGIEGSNDNTGRGRGSANVDADYNTQTGLGVSGIGGLKFDFGRPANTYNEMKTGTANATLYPHFGFGAGHASNATAFAGLGAEANWKPRFLKKTPLSLYGKAQLQAGFGGGATDDATSGTQSWSNSENTQTHDIAKNNLSFRPSYSLQAGIKAPLRDVQSTVRGIDIRDLNLPSIERNASEESTEEGMPIPDGIGVDWEKGNQLNASPIHKRWQPNTGDIFVPNQITPNATPMTYDPSMGEFENNTEEMNNYSKGGGIHIDPKNKGKFTASAKAAGMGTQEFASHVLANRGSYTPLQVQRANFAHNAASWQHAQGGFNNKGFQSLPPAVQAKIRSNSFADGGQLTEFNEGGTHEQSPIGGIPQGMAPDGKLNLVEQGETKLNAADYIFSDQIKVDKETAALYDLPKGDVGKTFADVSKKLNRPNSRRDNDTIEQVAIQRDLENLMQAQEKQKEMQKDKDVAEFAAKYPELAQNMPVPGQEQQMMGQPQMDPNAMQQGMMEEQMNPPANMPQQPVDPAMMAQMQQMQQMGQMPMSYGGSLFNCGGKMYNAGGHMYGVGGNVMRGIGSAAYGVGEGLLDTLTFGLTDNLTDKGFNKLSSMGNRAQSEIEKDASIRGFGNVGGAVLGSALTGGATTSAAVGEAAEGLASGASNIKGTGEKFDKIATGIGQGVSTISGFMGPEGAVQAEGVLKGNEAVNQLMNAKQNPFINQATQFANRAFANGGSMNYSMYQPFDHVTQYGGPLNMPTANHPYLNYLANGGGMEGEPTAKGEPTLAFNLNGIVAKYTLSQAQADPLILETFGADVDEETGNLIPNENLEAAKLAIEERFDEEQISNRINVGLAQQEYNASLNSEANPITNPDAVVGSDMPMDAPRLPGETDEQYARRMHTMKMGLDKKALLGEIKQTPAQGAMMALPALYNLGRGIFEKPRTLDYKEYQQKANIEPYTMNVDPQVAEVRKAYAGATQAVKNAAPGSGAYLTNMQNLAAGKQAAMNELLTKKEMFDKDAKYKADMANREIAAQNLALQMQLQAYNDQAKAAKLNSLKEGFGQLADIAANQQGIDMQEAYLQAVAPSYATNFKYSSILDQLQELAKKRKSNKSKKD